MLDCPNKQILLQQALTLPLGDATLGAPEALTGPGANNFRHASPSFDGWSLAESGRTKTGSATLDILKAGQVVASITRDASNGLNHHAYSFSPDGETIVSAGSYGVMTGYDREGKTLGAFAGHEGNVFAVAPSPDGRYLVSGSADETVRLWNLKTRELLVSLFQGRDGEWVMWTPQGFYASSPAGARLIGWQINRGLDHEAEYVTAAQLRKALNRPDIVVKAIQLASAEEAVKQSTGTNFRLADLLAKPVPRFRIVSPAANASLAGGTAQIDLALEETPDPVNLVRLYVNGVQVDARQPEEGQGPGFKPGPLTFKVPLAKGSNLIRAVAVNGTGETSAEVAVDSQSEGALDKRGTLRILAIGVDKYPGLGMACRELDGVTPKSCDLDFAVSDATAFAKAMAAQLGPQHQKTVSTVLINGGESGEPKAGKIWMRSTNCATALSPTTLSCCSSPATASMRTRTTISCRPMRNSHARGCASPRLCPGTGSKACLKARPSRTASSPIVRGGAIFTVCPQAPTGAKNSSPLWKQRSMTSWARSWFGSFFPGWVICKPPTRPRQL